MNRPVLTAIGLTKVFATSSGPVTACADIDLQVSAGELVVIRGPSGAGKTTMLNLLGGLTRPTSGSVEIRDRDLSRLTETELASLRQKELGYIVQTFGLLPMLSAAENVEIPLRLLRTDPGDRRERVAQALDEVGLTDHANQRPAELSGGQQQRVGVARALIAGPPILLADEPTGQLDSGTASSIMELIGRFVVERGLAAIVTTHHQPLMEQASRLLEIRDGRLTHADPSEPSIRTRSR